MSEKEKPLPVNQAGQTAGAKTEKPAKKNEKRRWGYKKPAAKKANEQAGIVAQQEVATAQVAQTAYAKPAGGQAQKPGQSGQRQNSGKPGQKPAAKPAKAQGAQGQTQKPQQAKPQKAGQNLAAGNKQAQKRQQNAAGAGAEASIQVISLGGLGEVGKNATVFECQGDMLLVDCGVVFPDADMFGVDLVIPDFTFIVQNRQRFKGILITHGHEDHIGALPYLLKQVNLPIYATRLTVGFIQNKLKEHGLLNSTRFHVIEPGQKLNFGCMEAEAIHVNHSMPDAVGFAISSPAGVIITTGDFKIDYTPISGGVTDLATFAEYGKKGVLALLSDSTNAERSGFSRSERTVGESFAALFSKAEGQRILIATFASSLYRVQQILDMAAKYNRKVVFSGRSMVNNCTMALELGYLTATDGLIIDVEELNKYPAGEVVIVTTGSQGEPLAALSRMAAGMHRQIHVGEGDFIIISASPIPGNEKGVGKVVNSLLRLGADVIYESMYDVHVSGHAYQDEQKLLLSLVHPQYFMPVHGEYKQLVKHAGLAYSVGIPKENVIIGDIGQVYSFSKSRVTNTKEVPSGRVLVDGLGVGDVGSVVLRDRFHLAQDGLVIVVASIDAATGELLSGPDIVSRGFVYVKEAEQLMNSARNEVLQVLKNQRKGKPSFDEIKTQIREALGTFVYKKTKRSPMILPIIMEL